MLLTTGRTSWCCLWMLVGTVDSGNTRSLNYARKDKSCKLAKNDFILAYLNICYKRYLYVIIYYYNYCYYLLLLQCFGNFLFQKLYETKVFWRFIFLQEKVTAIQSLQSWLQSATQRNTLTQHVCPNQIQMLLFHPIIMNIQHTCPFKVYKYVP